MAIQCIAQILELGSLYSYLPDVLVDFVPFLESLFIDADKYGNVNEVFKISFLLTKIVSLLFCDLLSSGKTNAGRIFYSS